MLPESVHRGNPILRYFTEYDARLQHGQLLARGATVPHALRKIFACTYNN